MLCQEQNKDVKGGAVDAGPRGRVLAQAKFWSHTCFQRIGSHEFREKRSKNNYKQIISHQVEESSCKRKTKTNALKEGSQH